MQKNIASFEIEDYRWEHSRYFTGIDREGYDKVYIGIGDSYNSALEDAIDQICTMIDLTPQSIALLESEKKITDVTGIITGRVYDEHYYVGIRFNFEKE